MLGLGLDLEGDGIGLGLGTHVRLVAGDTYIFEVQSVIDVTNVEVRATIGCYPLSHLVTDKRLRLFGHIARSSPQEDHHRAVAAVIRGLPQIGRASCRERV